ncbi:hypothetical protein HDU87_000632 [Geranomyces variabilis]|uniref:Uncharacterized protein n=1 Tax=Geranomyces variabilis TaxID=109894 RepID=A0AAD5XM87_9FUNG|nr:hypothetical protein HDU87_000632 [Geranomyces variabilis]
MFNAPPTRQDRNSFGNLLADDPALAAGTVVNRTQHASQPTKLNNSAHANRRNMPPPGQAPHSTVSLRTPPSDEDQSMSYFLMQNEYDFSNLNAPPETIDFSSYASQPQPPPVSEVIVDPPPAAAARIPSAAPISSASSIPSPPASSASSPSSSSSPRHPPLEKRKASPEHMVARHPTKAMSRPLPPANISLPFAVTQNTTTTDWIGDSGSGGGGGNDVASSIIHALNHTRYGSRRSSGDAAARSSPEPPAPLIFVIQSGCCNRCTRDTA